ncbi:hypothetical protein K474DRAFT_1771712 [Panus rudis PR-1116 ss-1]|nr:hypothetical protein K474DRAFT_1771712 [Panus rudis PR-1116 ss-1]
MSELVAVFFDFVATSRDRGPGNLRLELGSDCTFNSLNMCDIPVYLQNHLAFRPMFQHRIVLNEFGLPLTGYQNSKQLCFIIRDALIAHQRAWEDAHVLHHDINEHNMIVSLEKNEEGGMTAKASLLDWDSAKFRNQLGEASNGNRSGTWTYLSAPRLAYPGKPWELVDDLESFVHLINCFALRFHWHNLAPVEFLAHDRERYESCQYDPQIKAFTGCPKKVGDVKKGDPGFELDSDPDTEEPTNLAVVIDKLMKLCQQHWKSLDAGAMDQYAPRRELKKYPRRPITEVWSCKREPQIEEPTRRRKTTTIKSRPRSPFLDHKEIIQVIKDCLGRRGWPAYVDRTEVDQVAQAKLKRERLLQLENMVSFSNPRLDNPRKAINSSSRCGMNMKRKEDDMHKSASEDDTDLEIDHEYSSDVPGDGEDGTTLRKLKRSRLGQE